MHSLKYCPAPLFPLGGADFWDGTLFLGFLSDRSAVISHICRLHMHCTMLQHEVLS